MSKKLFYVFVLSGALCWVPYTRLAAQTPVVTSVSPTLGPAGTLVTVTGQNLEGATGVTVGGTQGILVNKSPARLQFLVPTGVSGGQVAVTYATGTVTATSFTVQAPSAYAYTQQGNKIVGAPRVGIGFISLRPVVSDDGTTLAFGTPFDASSTGAGWVYSFDGATWADQSGKLVPAGATGASEFGYSIALSSDGNTFAVAGPADSSGHGAVWVYTRSGTTWSQQGPKLKPNDATGASRFGGAIAMSADGNILVIAGENDNSGRGAVWTFSRTNGVWAQQGTKLTDSDIPVGERLGVFVALSDDASTLAVTTRGTVESEAYTFKRNGAVWEQFGTSPLTVGGKGQGDEGLSAALNQNGQVLAVGAPGSEWVLVYGRSGDSWVTPADTIRVQPAFFRQFGMSTSLNATGDLLVVGGNAESGYDGGLRVFSKPDGSSFTEGPRYLPSDITSGDPGFGYSNVSSNGGTIVVSAPRDSADVGAVWIYQINGVITASDQPSALVETYRVGPNPAEALLTVWLSLKRSSKVRFELVSSEGRVCTESEIALASGAESRVDLAVGALARGLYVLRAVEATTGLVLFTDKVLLH